MADAESRLKVLMLAALGGDAASYRVLLAETGAHLRGYYAKRLGREAADIEDLVQETLIALHTRRATYDTAQPLTPWVYAIARYKLIDHLRKRDRHRTLPLDDADALFAPSETEDAIARRDVDRLLGNLPARTQTLVRGVKVEGLSTQEAATRTGMSESAVKVAVHRAMRSLSAMLGKEGGDEN
jgi:RNA polymerase sigma-70 factor (ECF subfamily)